MNGQVHAMTTEDLPPRSEKPGTATLDDGTEIQVYNVLATPVASGLDIFVVQAEHCGQWYVIAADCG
jgi:hypothetical protein